MKLWLITNEGPSGDGIGARFLRCVGQALIDGGIDVRFIFPTYDLNHAKVHFSGRERPFIPRSVTYEMDDVAGASDVHPVYPYNVLEHDTALSYQLAEELLSLAQQEGLPDVIEITDMGGLGYYTQLRQLLEDEYLPKVPIVIQALKPTQVYRHANHEPVYKLPYYLHSRMELFCYQAAAGVVVPSLAMQVALQDLLDSQLTNCVIKRLPFLPERVEDVLKIATAQGPELQLVCFEPLAIANGVIELVRRCKLLWDHGLGFNLRLTGRDTEYPPKGCTVKGFLKQRYAKEVSEGRLKFAVAEEEWENLPSGHITVIPNFHPGPSNGLRLGLKSGGPIIASKDSDVVGVLMESNNESWLFDWNVNDDFENCLSLLMEQAAESIYKNLQRLRSFTDKQLNSAFYAKQRLQHYHNLCAAKNTVSKFPFPQHNWRYQQPKVYREFYGKSDLVSIVIPYYNAGEFIDDLADAIEASIYKNLEIILVNDGSDNAASLEAIQRQKERFGKHLRVCNIPNQGLANARNVGAEEAKGEFLAFIDADDSFAPCFLERAVKLFQKYTNVHLVYSWERCFGGADSILPNWNLEFPYLLGHNMVPARCVVRRDVFLSCGGNLKQMAYNFEDFECWIRMLEQGCNGISIPEPLVKYRVRKDSLWQSATRDQLLYLHELMVKLHPELYGHYGAEIFNLLNANGPGTIWEHPSCDAPIESREAWLRKSLKDTNAYARGLEEQITALKEKVNEGPKKKKRRWRRRSR